MSLSGLRVVAAVGDAVIILLFAAIGRASHHETANNPLLHTAGTAAPFLVGWFAGSLIGGAYTREGLQGGRRGLIIVGRSWLLGGLIGLTIRSVLERRVVPVTFAIIALGFNLALLLAWRWLFGKVLMGWWGQGARCTS
jgi:hypothetical protein